MDILSSSTLRLFILSPSAVGSFNSIIPSWDKGRAGGNTIYPEFTKHNILINWGQPFIGYSKPFL